MTSLPLLFCFILLPTPLYSLLSYICIMVWSTSHSILDENRDDEYLLLPDIFMIKESLLLARFFLIFFSFLQEPAFLTMKISPSYFFRDFRYCFHFFLDLHTCFIEALCLSRPPHISWWVESYNLLNPKHFLLLWDI